MSSSPSSKLAIALVAVVLAIGAVGAAGAVTVGTQNTPSDAKVGETATATYVLTELYKDPSYEQWTLVGTTELENVTWTVQTLDQAGNVVGQSSYDGTEFSHGIDIGSGAAEVRIKVTGTVPEVGNYSYRPEQSFVFAEFRQSRQGGTTAEIRTFESHHYTEKSRSARRAIDSARAAIESAGGHPAAQKTLDNAISAYDAGNFDNAIDLAEQAEGTATKAKQNRQRNQLLLFAGGGIVLLVAVIGGVFWYRSQRTARKL